MEELTADKLYEEIWDWIKELQYKYKHRDIVMIKATLFSFGKIFDKYEPEKVSIILKELVLSERIITDLFNDNVHPFDAKILPSNF